MAAESNRGSANEARPSYRTVPFSLWRSGVLNKLETSARMMALALLTHPDLTNRMGYSRLSLETLATACGLPVDYVVSHLPGVVDTLGAHYDADARVIWMPWWFRDNPIPALTNLKGNAKDLHGMPRASFEEEFANHVQLINRQDIRDAFPAAVRDAFDAQRWGMRASRLASPSVSPLASPCVSSPACPARPSLSTGMTATPVSQKQEAVAGSSEQGSSPSENLRALARSRAEEGSDSPDGVHSADDGSSPEIARNAESIPFTPLHETPSSSEPPKVVPFSLDQLKQRLASTNAPTAVDRLVNRYTECCARANNLPAPRRVTRRTRAELAKLLDRHNGDEAAACQELDDSFEGSRYRDYEAARQASGVGDDD